MAGQQQKLPIQNIWRNCSCAIVGSNQCHLFLAGLLAFLVVWIKLLASNAMRANAQFANVIVILCAPKSKFVFLYF
jgi:hypothetical protein